jgi:hypothetical protein
MTGLHFNQNNTRAKNGRHCYSVEKQSSEISVLANDFDHTCKIKLVLNSDSFFVWKSARIPNTD